MEIITTKNFKSVTGIQNNFLAQTTMQVLGLKQINSIYNECYHEDSQTFLAHIMQNLKLQIDIDPELLKRIPKTGAFITVSNHPFGAIDGILLLDLIQAIRPDFKVMGNQILKEIKPIADAIIQVDPFNKNTLSNLQGIKSSIVHLDKGKPLGIFPAGEVSSWSGFGKGIQDKEWEKSIIKLIKKSEVPVIPIYFHGKNSWLFNSLGLIHPSFRTYQLPREALNKKGVISIRIGKPISVRRQNRLKTVNEFRGFLRAKTYILGTDIQSSFVFKKSNPILKASPIISQTPQELIIYDLVQIPAKDKLFSSGSFDCFCTSVNQIPNIIREIGRLREISFRAVGEGTNKSIDMDHYDLYYKHLFLWDRENQKIVGAYRIGNGNEIMHEHGKSGLYLNSLFKISNELTAMLSNSLELGRSFVSAEYQKSSRALFLLWKGVLVYSSKIKGTQYLIGPVSISGRYNKTSKMLMGQFLTEHFFDSEIAQYIKPRKKVRFPYSITKPNLESLKGETLDDLDRIIDAIEPGQIKLPVLLKKYLKQKAKIVGFNTDPKFSNALDGFIVLKLADLDKTFVKDFS